VVSVTNRGVVTALAPGLQTITVRFEDQAVGINVTVFGSGASPSLAVNEPDPPPSVEASEPQPPPAASVIEPRPAPPSVTPPTGGNAYFEFLTARPEHFVSYSLRGQPQLDALTGAGASTYFTYDPAADAAYFFKPVNDRLGRRSDSIPGNQQLKMPIGLDTGCVLITWDFWYTTSWEVNRVQYKTFMVRFDTKASQSGHRYWTLTNALGRNESFPLGSFARSHLNIGVRGDLPQPDGMVRSEPFTPSGRGAVEPDGPVVPTNKWVRYWHELCLNQPPGAFTDWSRDYLGGVPLSPNPAAGSNGNCHMLSSWIAWEGQPPIRTLYRVPRPLDINPNAGTINTHVAHFDFEFNTSAPPPAQVVPFDGWGRNVVVLHNAGNPEAFMVEP
jgi:hypothetical protein